MESDTEQIQKFITDKPSHVIRWGTLYIFVILCALVSGSWFIKGSQRILIPVKLYLTPIAAGERQNPVYQVVGFIPEPFASHAKVGQSVRLQFQAYPYNQYGSIEGQIDFINSQPTDSGYQIKINLPHGLHTTRRQSLEYSAGMMAEADLKIQGIRLFTILSQSKNR